MNFQQALETIKGTSEAREVVKAHEFLACLNLGDDDDTNHRDQARLIVMAKAALEAAYMIPEAGSPLHKVLVSLAYWCIDRAMWVGNHEDDAELS